MPPKIASKALTVVPASKQVGKVKAKSSAADYTLEVRSTATAPIKVYGKVSQVDQGFRLVFKRPRSSKTDTFIFPVADVYAAEIGDNGYVLTDHVAFHPEVFTESVNDAEIKGGEIWGTNPATGNDVFINREAMPVAVRYASYSE